MASKEGDAATDAPNSHRLAHDLSNADVWRSTDISLQQQLQRVEIITPKLMMTTAGDGLTSTAAANRVKKFTPVTASNSINNSNTTTFSSLKIHPQLVEDLRRCGFTRPSPIQSTALPLGRLGIDLIAQSKSGTGKTLVFVICALEMVLIEAEAAEDAAAAASKPMAIIVAPTREIALQIGSIIDALTSSWTTSRGIPFSCYKAIGGTKVSEHLGQLATSAVVVGTPGRLCCLLEMDLLPAAAVRLLVLDECDKLVGEESFRRQIDKLYGRLPASKQMIVTSATLSEPLTLFLARYMANTAEDGGGGGPALVRLAADSPALVGVSQLVHRTVGHPLDYLNFEAKIGPLVALLRAITFRQAVIFSNYQTRAKYLLERLQQQQQQQQPQTDTGVSKNSKADRPLWTAALISGDMAQRERAEAIAAFRRHRVRLLISTDLTARGIDVESVNLVVNVDVPLDGETYLHRVGRAGRFGSAGLAITLLGNEADVAAFEAIRAQYPGLEVRPLTLPLTASPWAVFYEGRGLGGGGGHKGGVAVADICKQGGGLPVNELFAEMVAGIAELSEEEEEEEEEFIGHNQTAVKEEEGEKESDKQSPEVVSVSQRQSGDTFTATTTTITNNLNCDLQSTTIELEHELEECSSEDRDDDGQAEKEESDLQVEQQQPSAAAVFNLSEVSAVQLPAVDRKIGRNGSSSSNNSNNNSIHLDHRQVHVQRPPPPPTLTSTLTATTTSVQQQQQFKNAFLRPISSPFALFSSLKPSNVAICKYLLHGGGGGDLNNKNISPQHYQNQPHANISSHR